LLDAVLLGPALLAGAWKRKGRFALVVAAAAANALFLALSICFIFYAVWKMRTPEIVGFQTRYLIPAAIVALFLPLAVAEPAAPPPEGVRAVTNGVALGVLPLFLLARLVELMTDLSIRYW
jgi:hypothetical protein